MVKCSISILRIYCRVEAIHPLEDRDIGQGKTDIFSFRIIFLYRFALGEYNPSWIYEVCNWANEMGNYHVCIVSLLHSSRSSAPQISRCQYWASYFQLLAFYLHYCQSININQYMAKWKILYSEYASCEVIQKHMCCVNHSHTLSLLRLEPAFNPWFHLSHLNMPPKLSTYTLCKVSAW